MDVIVTGQWCVLQSRCSVIIISLMDVIVRVKCCVLQTLCSVIIISVMDVIDNVQWCVLQTWSSVILYVQWTWLLWYSNVFYKLGLF